MTVSRSPSICLMSLAPLPWAAYAPALSNDSPHFRYSASCSSVCGWNVTAARSTNVRKPSDTSSALGADTSHTDTPVSTSCVLPCRRRSMRLASEMLAGLPKISPSHTTMVSAPMMAAMPV